MTPTVSLPDGTRLPALGLGTWHLGESAARAAHEVASLRRAFELGYRVVDTAEMYAEGGAEQVLGRAIAESVRAGTLTRDELFVVSKVYPHNATRSGVEAACERSLRRLGLDRIDLYLLHWPGPHPLRETVAGFEALKTQGRIVHWGVSNFDIDDLIALARVPAGAQCAANQVYFSASTRGVEFDLLPWQRERSMPLMAYCPLDQGDLAQDETLQAIAARRGATPSQVGVAWLIGRGGVMPIPKALGDSHLRANLASADLQLGAADLAEIDARFPPPRRKQVLAMR
jgi:diketogulonate reductase-like aldo/keto reductase